MIPNKPLAFDMQLGIRRIPEGIGPTSVVCDRLITNGSGFGARTMARDRPSPYVKGRRFFTVARGTGPRDRSMARDRPIQKKSLDIERRTRDRSMARDRPSPYGEVSFFIVARG